MKPGVAVAAAMTVVMIVAAVAVAIGTAAAVVTTTRAGRSGLKSSCIHDVVTKSVGTSNPYNMIRATFDALTDQTSPKSVAQRRGKKVADLLGRGGAGAVEAEASAEAITE